MTNKHAVIQCYDQQLKCADFQLPAGDTSATFSTIESTEALASFRNTLNKLVGNVHSQGSTSTKNVNGISDADYRKVYENIGSVVYSDGSVKANAWLMYILNLTRVEPAASSGVQADLFLESSEEESNVNLSLLHFFEKLLHIRFVAAQFAGKPATAQPVISQTNFHMCVRNKGQTAESTMVTSVDLRTAESDKWTIRPLSDRVASFVSSDGTTIIPDVVIIDSSTTYSIDITDPEEYAAHRLGIASDTGKTITFNEAFEVASDGKTISIAIDDSICSLQYLTCEIHAGYLPMYIYDASNEDSSPGVVGCTKYTAELETSTGDLRLKFARLIASAQTAFTDVVESTPKYVKWDNFTAQTLDLEIDEVLVVESSTELSFENKSSNASPHKVLSEAVPTTT